MPPTKYQVKYNSSLQGSVMIEATLSLIVLILIIFGAITFNSQIRQRQKLNNIIRNVSIGIVQDCTGKLMRNENDAESCAKIVINNTLNQKSDLNMDFSIRVSNYSNLTGSTELIFSCILATNESTVAEELSHHTIDTVNENFSELLNKTNHATIVEAYMIDNNTALPFRNRFFGISKIIYDSAFF